MWFSSFSRPDKEKTASLAGTSYALLLEYGYGRCDIRLVLIFISGTSKYTDSGKYVKCFYYICFMGKTWGQVYAKSGPNWPLF
jgi:hypothetical protein